MRIKQKLLLAFLFISFLTLGISFGISFVIQKEMAAASHEVGGETLPGSIALSRMTTEFYRIDILLDEYVKNPDPHAREQIEKALSALSSHQITHNLYHPDDNQILSKIEQVIQQFSRSVAQYLLLLQKEADREEALALRQQINSLLNDFVNFVNPHIERDFVESHQKLRDMQERYAFSRKALMVGAVVILLITIILSIIIANLLSKPLRLLRDAVQKVGAGQLDIKLAQSSKDEIGELARAFNDMSENLAAMHNELISANQRLKSDIAEKERLSHELTIHRNHLEELVTERTTELEEQRLIAEQANAAKSDFLANMSHELRTPMHAILSFAGMGEEKINIVSNEKLHHYFTRIHQSGERLLALLNDLLDLSKLEAGQMEFTMQEHDLKEVVLAAMAELSELAKSKSLTLEVNDPDIDTVALFDQDKLLQVMRNLLSNAIKFTSEGKSISISFAATGPSADQVNSDGKEAPAIAVKIVDQGVGIPENELEQVFDKFIQSSKTKSGSGGTGLGLAICKEIIEGHGGTIWAKNNPEGGAIFTFTIPR